MHAVQINQLDRDLYEIAGKFNDPKINELLMQAVLLPEEAAYIFRCSSAMIYEWAKVDPTFKICMPGRLVRIARSTVIDILLGRRSLKTKRVDEKSPTKSYRKEKLVWQK